jgi:hypothetical protein
MPMDFQTNLRKSHPTRSHSKKPRTYYTFSCKKRCLNSLKYIIISLLSLPLMNGVIPIFLWLLFLWPIFLWPNHQCVDIPTKKLLKYRSILTIIDLIKTTHHYFNSPMLLCVYISTNQNSYMSILQQTKAPICRYSYRPKLLCVDIPKDQSSYVSIFLQTKAPMYQYSYRPKLLCVDIPTDQSSYVSIFLQRLPVISTTKAPMLRYFNSFSVL